MKRAFLVTSAPGLAGLALAAALAATRLNTAVFFGSVMLGLFTLPPALVGLLIVAALRKDRPDSQPWLGHVGGILAAWCLCVVLLAPAFAAGSLLLERRVRRAMDAAEPAIAALESHRREHGRYPERIDLPPLIEAWGRYASCDEGESYEIFIEDPRSVLGFDGWRYEPGEGEWRYRSD